MISPLRAKNDSNFGSGALYGKMLLLRNIKNDKI